MKNFLEVKKYRLKCISPVHIGSGVVLQPFEYLYDYANSMLYVPNREKWMLLLDKHNLTDKFMQFLASNTDRIRRAEDSGKINIYSWLIKNDVSPKEISSVAERIIEVSPEYGRATLNAVNMGVQEANGNLYIPGSSIKGMFRTGILFATLLNDEKLVNNFSKKLSYAMNGRDRFERKKLLSNLGSEIEKEILRKLKYDEKESAMNDVMRGIKVSDARPVEEYNSVLVQKIDASTYAGKSKETEKQLPLFRECCKPGSEYEFSITLDREMLKLANVKSIETVIKCAKAYTRRGLSIQKEVFAKYYPNEFEEAKGADLFLGGGTGFLQKSLWFSLWSDKNKGMEMLKIYLEDNFHMHRHKQLDREISPRTLKLAKTDKKQLMGMCSLKEVQL